MAPVLSHSLRSFEYLVVGEEGQAAGEGRNVHDGDSARHPGRRSEESELGHLAVGGAAAVVLAGLLLVSAGLIAVVLLRTESHHLLETER